MWQFMIDGDAPYLRLRELAKKMASENDPAKLRILTEELRMIVEKQRAVKTAQDGSKSF